MSDFSQRIESLKTGGFDKTRVRALIYGESGAGKTVFASSWPQPVLFLDMDDGLASVTLPVDRVSIASWEELFEATKYLSNVDHGYATIVVDSLNEVQHLAMKYILKNFPSVKRSYDSLPSVSDYGKMINDVDQWVRILKGLDCHVVFLSQVQRREFQTDVVQPGLVGKNTASNICRMMDIIGYIHVGDSGEAEATRFVAFNVPDYVGKDRSGKLPPVLEIQDRDKAFKEMFQYWD